MQTDASTSSSSSSSPPPPPTRSDDKSGATVDTAETEAAAAATRKAANLARLAAAMRVNEVRLRATVATAEAKTKRKCILFFKSATLSDSTFWPTGESCTFEVHAIDDVHGMTQELAAVGIDLSKRLVCLVFDQKMTSAHYATV